MSNKSVSDFVAATMDAVLKSEAHKALFGTQYKYASDENDAKCSKCGSDKCTCGDSAMADSPASGSGQGADPYVFKPDTIKAKPPEAPKPADKAKADDSFAWDDNDARKKKKDEDEEDEDDKKKDEDDASFAWDDNDARKSKKKDDDEEDEKDDKKDKKDDDSDANDLASTAAFDVAIDSLLSASAALDSVGMEKSAALSLRLATLVVEAKKKDKDDKNAAKDKAKAAKEKEKAAKEKEKLKAQKEKDKAKADAQAAKDKAAKDKAKEKEKLEKEKAKEKAAKEKAKK